MNKKILNIFRSSRLQIIAAAVLMLVLSALIYATYDGYRKTIVTQQQQNMLSNARSISRSIELFIDDTVDSLKVITLDKEFINSISSVEQGKFTNEFLETMKTYYEAGGKEIDSVLFIDKTGRILTRYPQGIDNSNNDIREDIKVALASKSTYIGKAYLNKDKKNFILNIYEPVFVGDKFKGIVSAAINLNVIYDKLIAPVKVGEKGYALVKDQHGIIIMHTVKEQVGMDVIETRKQVFPGLDYRELENLINEQLQGKEGTAIYHSYWWGDNVLEKAKKLNAYTPVQLGDQFWIVALTMSYDEIQGPINLFLTKLIGISVLVISIVCFFLLAFFKMKRNKEELENETKYLKMLNETSEQLRKKEAELYHSHKLKMVGTLAGGIAHDVNNLLTPILGYSELLLMQIPENSDYHEEVHEIYKASQKGKDLIEQILSFSRKDNGIVEVEAVDINEVTRETVKLFKSMIPKSIKLVETIKDNCGYVKANFTQLHQVIFNLCNNSYQAIKNNRGTIEVSLNIVDAKNIQAINKKDSEAKGFVEVSVKDTGCGMDEETKQRIFDPFFTTKEIGEGTGLGLFVVQSIIDKYGGTIAFESEKGTGSTFNVYLPLIDYKEDAEQDVSKETELAFKARILVVDDNEDIIKVLEKGLTHLGYEVFSEADSLRALETFKARKTDFDLVITDFIMPGLKGSEFAAKIKEINKATKVILITGYMDENLEELNNNEVFDACISKPIELAKLSEAINKLLSE